MSFNTEVAEVREEVAAATRNFVGAVIIEEEDVAEDNIATTIMIKIGKQKEAEEVL